MTGLDDSEVLIAREDTLTKDPFVSFILKQDTPHEIWPDVPLTAEQAIPWAWRQLIEKVNGARAGSKPFNYSLNESLGYLHCSAHPDPSRTFECTQFRIGNDRNMTKLYRIKGSDVFYVMSTAKGRGTNHKGKPVGDSGGSESVAARLANGFVLDLESVTTFGDSKSAPGASTGTPVRFWISHGDFEGTPVTDHEPWNTKLKTIMNSDTTWQYLSDKPGQTSRLDPSNSSVDITVWDESTHILRTEETNYLQGRRLQNYQQDHRARIDKAKETVKESFALLSPTMTHCERPTATDGEQSVAPFHSRLGSEPQSGDWMAKIAASTASRALPSQQRQYVTAAGIYFDSSGQAVPIDGLSTTTKRSAQSGTLDQGPSGSSPWVHDQCSHNAHPERAPSFQYDPAHDRGGPEGIDYTETSEDDIPVDPALQYPPEDSSLHEDLLLLLRDSA